MHGTATVMREPNNAGKDPSRNTLIARSGIHPTHAVFLPINATVINRVRITVLVVNLDPYLRKK